MILEYVSRSSKIQTALASDITRISNNNTNFNIYQIASDYLKNNRMIFVVLPTLFDAQNYYDKLSNLLDSEAVLFYPVDDMALASQFISSNEFKYERINTILNLLEDKPRIVITTTNGAIYKNLSKDKWNNSIIEVEAGKEYNINNLKKDLKLLQRITEKTTQNNFGYRVIKNPSYSVAIFLIIYQSKLCPFMIRQKLSPSFSAAFLHIIILSRNISK